MALEIITCDQGSQEWHEARRGIATASEFHAIMAKGEGKTRRTYMRKLAGEIITGAVADSYTNAAMERGKAMEAEARAAYEFAHNRQVETIGFVRNGRAGASPDGLIPGGVLEIKTKFPHLLIECFERGLILPPEHIAQVQGALWITERDRAEFVAYWPGMPLFWCIAMRDEKYIKELASEVARFNEELDAMVERIRNWGSAA